MWLVLRLGAFIQVEFECSGFPDYILHFLHVKCEVDQRIRALFPLGGVIIMGALHFGHFSSRVQIPLCRNL